MPNRYCKKCEENIPLAGRRLCLSCINANEREKKKLKLALKKFRVQKKKEKKREKRENNTRLLKKKLDKVFSEWVRKRNLDKNGNAMCVSCYKLVPWKQIQAGHYNSRSHLNTRWDERNVWPQCVQCNIFLKGNYPAYTQYLLNIFGKEWLQELINDRLKIRQWTAEKLKELIERFK